jgi:hypothetical protein
MLTCCLCYTCQDLSICKQQLQNIKRAGLLKGLPSSNWGWEQFTPENSRKLHRTSNSFIVLSSQPKISSITKPTEMKWTGHVRNKGKVRHARSILVGELERER